MSYLARAIGSYEIFTLSCGRSLRVFRAPKKLDSARLAHTVAFPVPLILLSSRLANGD
jgi:hypothetical protein